MLANTSPVRPFALLGLIAICLFVGAVAVAQDTAAEARPSQEIRAEDLQDFPFTGGTRSVQIRGPLTTTGDVATGVGRTTVTYGDMTVSADKMSVNLVTQTMHAEGNVVFKTSRDEIRAGEAHYDFRRQVGHAFDAEGVSRGIFFRTEWDEQENGASFQRLSEDEALFRGASYTASGFPVPTWKLQADEIILIPGERVFMRNAVLWVRGVPILWLPAYTRKLQAGSPWSFQVGYLSEYGGFARIGYQFIHESKVPDWNDPTKYITRSSGRVGLHADLFSRGAIGVGADYRYRFDFERHIGELNVYGVRDDVRDVEGDEEKVRYFYRHRHNSVFGKTIWQLNADWMSDPDIYYDLSDPFGNIERGRVPERRVRAAVTYLEEDWLARINGEIKDRITVGRYQDFTEFRADDLNYDPDPDFTRDNDVETDGISSDRYGRVSEKIEGRLATRLLPFFRTPLYWNVQFNAFDNLDAGFNELSDDDDRRLYGADIYGALTHRTRLSGDGRFTWLNTVGTGVGFYERTSDRLLPSSMRLPAARPALIDGLRFDDKETVVVGDDREVSYADVNPLYVWADYTSKLHARITENLSMYLKYTNRIGTSDSAGDFYERTGRLEAFEDIYNFPNERHWIEYYVNYSPLFPKIDTWAGAGYNLQSGSEKFANERLWYVGGGLDYENDPGEFLLATQLLYEGRQARDRSHPDEFQWSEIAGNITAQYIPNHGRYWLGLDIDGTYPLSDDRVDIPNRHQARFDEEDPDISIRPTIGRKFGPKYDVELFAEYNTRLDDFKEGGVLIKRDIYDADIFVLLGFRTTTFRDRDNDDDTDRDRPDTDRELNIQFGIKFKAPEEEAGLSPISIATMRDKRQSGVFVE